MVGDRRVHLDLVWIHGSWRRRRSIGFSLLWRAAGVRSAEAGVGEGLPLRQVTERSPGRGRLGTELGVLTWLLMYFSAVLKVKERSRREKTPSIETYLVQMIVIRTE